MRCFIAPLLLLLAPMATGQASVHTTITFEPNAAGAPVWDVRVEAKDLEGDVRIRLEHWGEWNVVDSLYVEWVSCAPPLLEDPPRGEEHAFDDHDGVLSLHYRLHPTRLGSEVQQRFTLLPTWCPSYSIGFAVNSVVELVVDGEPIDAERSIELRAPADMEIVSDFGGSARIRQVTELAGPLGNALIAFGRPSARLTDDAHGLEVEVVQFGAGFDATESVLETVLNAAPAMQRTTGHPIKNPLLVFITDNYGGGAGTDYGFRIGYTTDTPDWQRDTYYFHQHVAHELFHQWLGGYLKPVDQSLVWFIEGFTDYLALWHIAATGHVTREWFDERLSELVEEARTRSSLGQIAFGDPTVRWRDGDGPNEIMAYKGGTLLAFALDVELRARAKGTLMDLIAELCARQPARPVTAQDLADWLTARGLTEFHTRFIAGREIPDFAADKERAGLGTARADAFFALPDPTPSPGHR